MKEILNAQEAAACLGCHPQKVKNHINDGSWPFGKKPTRKGGRYEIYTRRMYKFFGMEIPEERKDAL